MKSLENVMCSWNPLHLLYLGLIDFEQALKWSSFDTFARSSNYPMEVSHT